MTTERETVKTFLVSAIGIAELADDVDIFDSGLANSLFAIELMTFIERTFSIKVTMDDLDMDNFRSVGQIVKFIQHKQSSVNV